MAEIALSGIRKEFDEFVAVRDLNFTIGDGEFFVMLGPSGCGKTTTLRMIAGLELPTTGNIRIDGEDVTWKRASQRDIAFVFQLFALYPHMTVRRNVSFPLRLAGLSRNEIKTRTEEVAKMLRIDHVLDRGVGGLSAGDRQRVALGRAIIRRAKAFLMDEPLGALDAEFRDVMCEELRLLHNRIGATTVYVTHDQVEAMAMADRICVMNHAEVLQVGAPQEVYDRPATKFVAGFIGSPSMNFMPVRGKIPPGSKSVKIADVDIPVPATRSGHSGDLAFLGARAEHIRISDSGELRGTVFGIEYTGARQFVVVDTEAGRIRLRAPNSVKVSDGENIGLEFDSGRVILFDSETDAAIPSENSGDLRDG